MLVWYADMPEETTYYLQRFNEYKYLFLGMIPLNFILPVLILINSDYKRIPWIIITAPLDYYHSRNIYFSGSLY